MVDFICDYYSGSLEDRPVRSQVEVSLCCCCISASAQHCRRPHTEVPMQIGYLAEQQPSSAPQQPESFEAVMQDVRSQIMPGLPGPCLA